MGRVKRETMNKAILVCVGLASAVLMCSVTLANPGEYFLIWTRRADDVWISAEISADGSFMVAGTDYGDRMVHVWRLPREDPHWRYPIHPGLDIRVNDVSISSDGSYFVAGTRYRILLFRSDVPTPIWSFSALEELAKLIGLDNARPLTDVGAVSISPDGTYFAAASYDGFIYLFKNEGANSHPVWSTRLSDYWRVHSLDVSENGLYIAAACENNVIFFSRDTNQPRWIRSAGIQTWSVSISRDGSRVAVGGHDMNVYLFDETGNELMKHSVGDVVWSVSISPDGSMVAAGSNNGWVTLFDAITGALMWQKRDPPEAPGKAVGSVSISDNKTHVVAGSDDHFVYIYRVEDGSLVWKYRTGRPGAEGRVESVSISADGYYVVAAPRGGAFPDYNIYLLGRGVPEEVGILERIPTPVLLAAIAGALALVGFLIKLRIRPKV